MIERTITDEQFRGIVAELWTTDSASERSKTIIRNRQAALSGLLHRSETNEAIRGTRWAAYQAITEYTDHVAPIADKRNPAMARAERVVTSSSVQQIKTRAFDLIAAL
jgi:hypothetical protein